MNVHEAFRRTKRFSETIIGLIQAGSDAGQLHQAFGSLAGRITSELRFQKAIKKATSYAGCYHRSPAYGFHRVSGENRPTGRGDVEWRRARTGWDDRNLVQGKPFHASDLACSLFFR